MNLIEITLTLRPSQKVSMNKWKCTIDGEERLVTSDRVQFHSNDFENISRRFNIKECVDVSMHWHVDYYLDSRGIRVYHD
jgi:hypothetical protein